jgi:hypothetical protein
MHIGIMLICIMDFLNRHDELARLEALADRPGVLTPSADRVTGRTR